MTGSSVFLLKMVGDGPAIHLFRQGLVVDQIEARTRKAKKMKFLAKCLLTEGVDSCKKAESSKP